LSTTDDHTRPADRSPLDADEDGRFPSSLRGGIVTDPAEIAAIHARVSHDLAAVPLSERLLQRLRRGLWTYRTPRSCGNCGQTLTPSGTCGRCDRAHHTTTAAALTAAAAVVVLGGGHQ